MICECRLAEARDFAPIARLLELYQYELSDIWDQDLDAAGEYGYDLARHRKAATSFAHIALVDGLPAGFALVAPAIVTRNEGCWMEQFFVLKKHRRTGVGRALAQHVFACHPGPWEVGQMAANLPARSFWRQVIGELTHGRFVEVEVREGWWLGTVQQFELALRTR